MQEDNLLRKCSFFFIGIVAFFSSCSSLQKYPAADRVWALPEIKAFETLDAATEYPENSILFVGSSSIRLWKTLARDLDPFPVIQRGYGGAHFRDLVFYTDRILSEHKIRMVVCFVANDISGSPKDGTPKEILQLFKRFVKQVRAKHPQVPIMQIAITPTQSRWKYWEEINQVNEMIKAYCEKTTNLYYIDTVPTFLNSNGQPVSEWFIQDQLHLNEAGYAVWSKLIRFAIEEVLN